MFSYFTYNAKLRVKINKYNTVVSQPCLYTEVKPRDNACAFIKKGWIACIFKQKLSVTIDASFAAILGSMEKIGARYQMGSDLYGLMSHAQLYKCAKQQKYFKNIPVSNIFFQQSGFGGFLFFQSLSIVSR